jgi:hypothetical protein
MAITNKNPTLNILLSINILLNISDAPSSITVAKAAYN